MLRWALMFLVIGLIAGVLGFTTVAGASIAIAKILFYVFIAIFLLLLIDQVKGRRALTAALQLYLAGALRAVKDC